MVSTNGNGPKLANIIRRKIAASLPDNMGAAIENVGKLRKKLREVAARPEEGPKRMKWYCGLTFPIELPADLLKDVRGLRVMESRRAR
jgi:precorrin-2 dehydrogenase/sirohydrochlorin ferrochelatase